MNAAVRSARAQILLANAGIAPMDLRICLMLICLPLAYKLLSFDFTAMGTLCDRPPIGRFAPELLYRALVENRCWLFGGNATRYIQVAAALLLIATVARPCRIFLGPAIVLVWLLDSGAYLYRFNIYTLDTPLALLTLLFCSPVKLHSAAQWNAQPRRDAQLAMLVCLTFVSTYYLLAGLAKFNFDPNWASVVRVGNYYPISYLWHGQVMPEPIDTFARVSSEVLTARPWLDTFSSFIVLIEQFVWILAPISLVARIHAGLFAAAYHIVVILSTGIVFLTWIPIALAVTLPFSTIARRFRLIRPPASAQLAPTGNSQRLVFAATLAVAFLAAWLPSLGTVYPPFYNYHAFGWRYPAFDEMKPFYRIGFRDPATRQLSPLPLHHGAFLDFIQAGYLDTSSRLLVEQRGNVGVETVFKTNVVSLLMALRPRDANGWLLGSWRAPNHLLSEPGLVDVYKIRQFKILKGFPILSVNGRPAQVRWQICGVVDLDHPVLERRVITYEVCYDDT